MSKGGGRRVVIEDAEWRMLDALRASRTARVTPARAVWRAEEQPFARLPGVRELLRIDALPRRVRAVAPAVAG